MATVKCNVKSKSVREDYTGKNNDGVTVSRTNCRTASLATAGRSLELRPNTMAFAATFTSPSSRPAAKSRRLYLRPASGYSWRPARGRACEYIADFERIGRRSLGRPQWKGRLKLFEIYFLHSMEYRNAVKLVGLAEGTFDYWLQEVKRSAGREFSRCGLFPPSWYFHS
jgi:hypothetical protein